MKDLIIALIGFWLFLFGLYIFANMLDGTSLNILTGSIFASIPCIAFGVVYMFLTYNWDKKEVLK